MQKNDSFSPKRATNIDGFFAKPVDNRPRRPIFAAHGGLAEPQAATAGGPADDRGRLAEMPRRSVPQAVLTSDASMTPRGGAHVVAGGERSRDRRRAGKPIAPDPEKQAVREAKKARRREKWRGKRLIRRLAAISGVLVLAAGLTFGFKFYSSISKLTGNNNPLSLLGVFVPADLKNDNGRVNILVAANSADDPGHNGANLTDSIMVISLDTKHSTALMLSVPRDLWVDIPGYGHAKINAAYPNGGIDTLREVVQDTLGIPIQYDALVNYGAFRDAVDAVGGITIDVDSKDPRGIYDPSLDWTSRTCCALAKYPNGPARLNGKQALDLARARGDAYGSYGYEQSDFTRTQYQRKMLMAIKDKAAQSSVIANPFKVVDLVDAVGNNVHTDLQVNEVQTLYTYMKKLNNGNIDSYNINSLKGGNATMLANYTSPEGQSALIPAAGIDDFSAIQAQLQTILTADPVTKEAATTVVLNGTDTSGLAMHQELALTGKGMTVAIGDAPAVQATNTIVDNSGGLMPHTLEYLKKQYNATVVESTKLMAGYPGADFILILGQSSVPATTASAAGG